MWYGKNENVRKRSLLCLMVFTVLVSLLTSCSSALDEGKQMSKTTVAESDAVLSQETAESVPTSEPTSSIPTDDKPTRTGEPAFPTYTTGKGEQTEGGFQVYLPEEWKEKVAVETYEMDITYGLDFYTASSEDGDRRHLISIYAIPEEIGDPGYADEKKLGTLKENSTEDRGYVLYAVFPSEEQNFSGDAEKKEYQDLFEKVNDLLVTVEAREGYSFYAKKQGLFRVKKIACPGP